MKSVVKRPLPALIACKGVIKGIHVSLTRVKGYQKCAKAVFGTPLNTPLTSGKDDFSCRAPLCNCFGKTVQIHSKMTHGLMKRKRMMPLVHKNLT